MRISIQHGKDRRPRFVILGDREAAAFAATSLVSVGANAGGGGWLEVDLPKAHAALVRAPARALNASPRRAPVRLALGSAALVVEPLDLHQTMGLL